jgi:iron complex outermembrane recepter protein
MTQINELARALRSAIAFGIAGAMLAPVAIAQDAADDAEELESVIVTGSRIKRADAETAQPVTVITREVIERSGKTSFGELLQSLPEVGPALTTAVNNGGNGATNVSLRSLGASRTLVLMNGRRWVPDLNGTVDLNTIPTGIIETIEVLKDGASAVYGSDAIAGVINIITKKDLEGATASGSYGESSEGDGTRYSADFTFGFTGDRGSVTISAGFVNEDPIFAGDRNISSVPNFGLPGLGGSGTTPQGNYGIGAFGGFAVGANGQILGAAPSAATATLLTNSNTSSGAIAPNNISGYRPFTANDTYNFAPDNYLLTPQERASIFAEGRYALTDWVTFNTHFLFNNRKSAQELAAMPVSLGLSGTSALTAGIRPAANNPYNPFGAEVTRVNRRFQEFGPRRFVQDVDTFRFGGGFTGAFDALERTFDWESGYSYTRNSNSSTTAGLFNTARIRNALSAIDDPRTTAFDPICVQPGTTAANFTAASVVGGGCVPLNIFGGNGSITPAMLDYLNFIAQDKFQTESRNYFASMSTTLFELEAGAVGVAVGYEHRKEEGFDLPDAIIAAGETTGNSRLPTSGGYSLDEFYVESIVPLLADKPFAELLELRFAGRYSDYDTFGDDENFSAGFQWKPISDLKLRGNYNEGLRAPSVTELFRGRSDSFPALTDPCSLGPIGTFATQAPGTQTNCRNGVNGLPPVPAGYAQSNQQIRITLGGEPTLTPENSKSYTFGVVYSPETFVENLDFNLDWWKVEITNRLIASRGAGTILIQCYRDADPVACARITRNATTGEITSLLATNENAGAQDIRGVDFGVGYRLPEFDIGNFALKLDATYYIQNNTTNLAFNPTTPFNYFTNNPENQNVGFGGATPRMRAVGDVNWALNSWSVNWRPRYQHRAVTTCAQIYRTNNPGLCAAPNNTFINVAGANQLLARDKVGATTYHDFSVAYRTEWDSTVRVGVNNAFDKDPPVFRDGTTNSYDSVTYDIPGSYWFINYTQKF